VRKQCRVTAFLITALLTAAPAFAGDAGADNYKAKCAMCHGPDGMGNTPAGKAMKSPSLSSPDILKMSDSDLIAVITKGKKKMPAFAGKLTEAEIKEVVVHLHTLQKQ
jgi:cytochrome c6